MVKNTDNKTVLRTRKDFQKIDGKICIVKRFRKHEPSKTDPYASCDVECSNGSKVKILITHKLDLQHLEEAFNEKADHEEIWLAYAESMRGVLFRLLHLILPKFFIAIHPEKSFEKVTKEPDASISAYDLHKQTRARKKWDPVPNSHL